MIYTHGASWALGNVKDAYYSANTSGQFQGRNAAHFVDLASLGNSW